MSEWHHWQDDDLILNVLLQPRASRNAIIGPHDDRLKITLTTPPIDGKANAALRKFLSKQFGVSQSAVTLLKGQQSRQKQLRIHAPKRLPAVFPNPL